MRKLIAFMHVSLDGFAQGAKDWDLGWVSFDEQLATYSRDQLGSADTVLWGRSTYQVMQQYWSSVLDKPDAGEHDREHSLWIHNARKVVVSRTMEEATWHRSTLIKDNLKEEVLKLKAEPGGDIVVIGSPRFLHGLMQEGLVDEYRITLNPVLLGEGVPLFRNIKARTALELVASRTFPSGVVGLNYRVKG